MSHETSPRDFFIEHLMEKDNKRVHFHFKEPCNILYVDQMLTVAKQTYAGFTMVLWQKIGQ